MIVMMEDTPMASRSQVAQNKNSGDLTDLNIWILAVIGGNALAHHQKDSSDRGPFHRRRFDVSSRLTDFVYVVSRNRIIDKKIIE
jgi:hypothetical protein